VSNPQEDVGGPYGYADFLAAISDPAHSQHQDMMNWHGSDEPFDPAFVNLDAISWRLERIKV
jgi:hypothetical protein